MKLTTERRLEIILLSAAAFFAANAAGYSIFKTGQLLPQEYYTGGTIFGLFWLGVLFFWGKRLS